MANPCGPSHAEAGHLVTGLLSDAEWKTRQALRSGQVSVIRGDAAGAAHGGVGRYAVRDDLCERIIEQFGSRLDAGP